MDTPVTQPPEGGEGPSGPAPLPAAQPARAPRNSIWNRNINRRSSREWALQMLFRLDVLPPEGTLDDFFAEFWQQQADILIEIADGDPDALKEFDSKANRVYRVFAEELVRGVWENRDAIDARIEGYLTNWTLSRMGGVDRNVLRVAFYELFFREDAPPVVIINEAVDVAKYFSTRDSGKFVNGILDRASHEVTRDARDVPWRKGRHDKKKHQP